MERQAKLAKQVKHSNRQRYCPAGRSQASGRGPSLKDRRGARGELINIHVCVCSTLYSLHLFFICLYNIIAASIRLRLLCLGCGSHTVMFSKETLSFFTSLRGNTAQALTAERWVFSEAQSFIHVHQMSALTLP